MATAAKMPPASGPEVVGSIVLLPVADIEIGDRLRSVDQLWAAALGKVMAAEGQHTEIEVCQLPGRKTWLLVAGAHRLTGARLQKMVYIRAKVVENDPAQRIAREISQELWRRDLDPIDRASFIASQVSLLKARAGIAPDQSPQAIAANARWQKRLDLEADDATETISVAYGFADEVGEMLGLTARTIRNDLMLQRIAPALIGRLRDAGHPALRNGAQLRALAKLDDAAQAAAVDRLLWAEEAGETRRLTLPEAIAAGIAKNKPVAEPETKRLNGFVGAFSRMTLAEKKGALAQLSGMLPTGYKLTFGEQPTAKGFSERHEHYREEALAAIDGARGVFEALIEDAAAEPIMNVADRVADMRLASTNLQLTRFSIVTDAFELGLAGDRA